MPGTDIEVIMASYDAINNGDIEGGVGALAENAEWHETDGALPERGVYRGREALRDFLTEFLATWESYHQEVVETRAAGDRVVVFIHMTGRGRESGAEVDARYAHVWQMRHGLGVRVDAYYDRDAALAAIEP